MIGVTFSGASVGCQVQPDSSIRDVIWTIGQEHAPRYSVHAYRGGGSESVEYGSEQPRIDSPVSPDPDTMIGTCRIALWRNGGPLVPAHVYQRPSSDPARRGETVYDVVIDVDGMPGRIIDGYRIYPPELKHWHAPMFWDESAQALTNDLFAVLVTV